MADNEQKEEHSPDFTTLAKQIDSKIDPDLIEQLKQLEVFNIFLKSDLFGNEELIPVGSCVDGSKVTVPGDSGDIDVLIVSNRVILKEYLFDYDNAYPAFLHIRVNNEHEKYFKTVKGPIEDVYLPTAVLKELQERLFFVSKMWMNSETQAGMSNDGKFFNITRTSAVGKEQMQLYPDEECAFEFKESPETLKFKLKRMEKFAKSAIGGILYVANNVEEIDLDGEDEDGSSAFETQYRSNSLEHDNTSLLEMLNKLLDIGKGKETGYRNTGNILNMNEDRQTDDDNRKCSWTMQDKDLDKDGNKNASDMVHAEPFRDEIYKRKLSQDSTATETKRNYDCSDSKLDHNCEHQNDRDSDSAKVTESLTTDTDIKKSTQRRTLKTETSFSKMKSTDFVPAFKFEGWPRVADEWVTRKTKWPSKVTLKKVLESGCQVVAKRPLALCSKPITEDRDPYFRLSFAISEIILAQSMEEQQLLCWRVLKAYQKCFLETKPKCLTSYHWKNVVFWVSEDLDESFWTDENVFVAVLKCLDYMKNCIQNRRLPFYFVRRMNLFNGCDETLLDKLGKQVGEIRREPLEFLKRFKAEPPNSERHFIDFDKVKDILSQETKAQNEDRLSEEIVDGFIGHFPSFCKSANQGGTNFIHTTFSKLLKNIRSVIEQRSSRISEDTLKSNSLQEKMFDGLDEIMQSIQNEDEKEILKVSDNLLQSIAHDKELNDDNGQDFERATKQSAANMFSYVLSAIAGRLKDDVSSENTSNLLASFQKLAMKMQEDFQSKNKTCDEAEEKESKIANGILSSFIGAFPKFIAGIKKSTENEDEDVTFADEFKKVFNEASQKIAETIRREGKTEKKSEMDIDLD